jgi:hypothetical protein
MAATARRRLTSLLKRKRFLILNCRILAEDHALRDTHMSKHRKFRSKHAEDTLLISLVMIGTLGLYLFAAYLIIAVL